MVVNAGALPSPAGPLLRCSVVAFAGVSFAEPRGPGGVRRRCRRRRLRARLARGDGRGGRRRGGDALLNGPLDLPQGVLPWISFVVGVHFLGLANVWDEPSLGWLGGGIAALGALGLGLAGPAPRRRRSRRSRASGPGHSYSREASGARSRRAAVTRGAGLRPNMAGGLPLRGSGPEDQISLPFTGLWLAGNSPARRVPSHGTDLFGTRYAIDFMAVDDLHRTATIRDWRSFLATEPPERFVAFGQPILAPASGTVADVHDAEIDHEARRGQLALVPYALGQAARVRKGAGAIAGNYVTIALPDGGSFVLLAHLQAGSIRVSVGQEVMEGQHVANCGNSGNSTQPHLHMQAMDNADPSVARGVPIAFRRFREWPAGAEQFQDRERGMPGEGSVVNPLPIPSPAAES